MRARPLLALCSAAALALAAWAGCGSSESTPPVTPAVDSGAVDCPACVTDEDCSGGLCAQVGGDSYCALTCPNGDECAPERACVPVSTVTGAQASVCLPRGDVCGVVAPTNDAGVASGSCGALVGPSTKAACQSCGTHPCQTNGWVVEMAIPLAGLGLTGRSGERLEITVKRCDQVEGKRMCGFFGGPSAPAVLVLD